MGVAKLPCHILIHCSLVIIEEMKGQKLLHDLPYSLNCAKNKALIAKCSKLQLSIRVNVTKITVV